MGIVEEAKQEVKAKHKKQKEAKAMKNKNIIETVKTIALTALIAVIIGFIGGVWFQSTVTNEISDKVQETVAAISQPESK